MPRKIFRSLLALTALCVFGAGLVWYLLGNEAFLKRQLHAAVMRETGRALNVEGILQLKLGATINVVARDVSFSNPGWAAEREMARIGSLRASVDLKSLFKGRPVIHDIALADCRLTLLENSQGERNWDLFPDADTREAPKEHKKPGRAGFRVNHLEASHCSLSHDAPQRNQPLSVDIEALDLQRLGSGKYVALASGTTSNVPFRLSGQCGPFRSLWQGGPFEHEFELRAGGISLQSKGSMTDVSTGRGSNETIRFSGPEIAVVTNFLALPPISTGAFDFRLQFHSKDDMTEVDIDGDLGSLDVVASGELDRLLKPSTGGIELTVTGPDLDALGRLFGVDGLIAGPYTFTTLTRFDNGRMVLSPAVLETAQGVMKINGELGFHTGVNDVSLDISLQSNDIGRWSGLWGRPARSEGAFSASAHMESDAGSNLHGSIEARYLNSRLEVSGLLGKLPAPRSPEIEFELNSANLAELAGLLAVGDLPVAPVHASGHFSLEETDAHFKDVEVSLANNRVRLEGNLKRAAQFAGSEFRVRADIPSMSSLGLLFGREGLPDQPLKLDATVRPAGRGLEFRVSDGGLGEIKLSLNGGIEDLNKPFSITADAAFDVPSARLLAFLLPEETLPDLPLGISGGLAYQEDKTRFRQLRLNLGGTAIKMDGEVNLVPGLEGSWLVLSGQGTDIAQLFHSEKLELLPKDFSFSGRWSKVGGVDTIEGIEVRLGSLKATLNGTVDQLFAPRDMALQVVLGTPDASVLNTLAGPFFADKPLSVTSQVGGSLKNMTFSNLSAEHGDSRVTGELAVIPGEITHLSGALHASFLDLGTWMDSLEGAGTDAETAAVPKNTAASEMVFKDLPVFEVDRHAFDLDFDVRIDRANLGNTEVEDIKLGILMLQNELRLDPLEVHDDKGSSIKGRLALDGTGSPPKLDMEVHGKDLRLGVLVAQGQDPATYPSSDVDIDLHGSGETWREMASTLDGRFRLYTGRGIIASGSFQRVFSDFAMQLFNALSPEAGKNQFTKFECTVFAAEVVAGSVRADPFIMQTDQLTVVSSGTVNLATERIDLFFNSKIRKGLGLSAGTLINPFIKVGGTLASPAIELAPARAAINTGAAVATAGLSVLAKSITDRFLSSKDPCGDARKRIEKRDAERR